jgi:hypothetical protein
LVSGGQVLAHNLSLVIFFWFWPFVRFFKLLLLDLNAHLLLCSLSFGGKSSSGLGKLLQENLLKTTLEDILHVALTLLDIPFHHAAHLSINFVTTLKYLRLRVGEVVLAINLLAHLVEAFISFTTVPFLVSGLSFCHTVPNRLELCLHVVSFVATSVSHKTLSK